MTEDPVEEKEVRFPGPELLLQVERFRDYDVMLQLIIFSSYLLILMIVSLLIREWNLIRKLTSLVPESVLLLLLGSLLGLAGNIFFDTRVSCLLPR